LNNRQCCFRSCVLRTPDCRCRCTRWCHLRTCRVQSSQRLSIHLCFSGNWHRKILREIDTRTVLFCQLLNHSDMVARLLRLCSYQQSRSSPHSTHFGSHMCKHQCHQHTFRAKCMSLLHNHQCLICNCRLLPTHRRKRIRTCFHHQRRPRCHNQRQCTHQYRLRRLHLQNQDHNCI